MTKKSKNRKGTRVVKKQKMAVPKRGLMAGDKMTHEYKRLLLDPCNAGLTKSPYGGDAGALVQRVHNVWQNALDSELVFYHPTLGIWRNNTAAGASGGLVSLNTTTPLSTQRAIAGCIELYYQGAESARAGGVCCAIVPGAVVWRLIAAASGGAGDTLDVANASSYFARMERTPVDRCSINWFPGTGDEDWTPGITYNATQTGAIEKIFASTHFAAVLVFGGGANFRFSATSVVESSNVAAGIAGTFAVTPWGVTPKTENPVNWKAAVADLARQDPSWYLDTFRKVAKFGLGLVGSALSGGLPGALGYLTRGVDAMKIGGSKSNYWGSGR